MPRLSIRLIIFFSEWRLTDFPKEYIELISLIQSGKVENIERYFNSVIEGDQYFLGVNTFYPFGHGVPSVLPPSEPRKSYTETGRPELHKLEVTMQSLVMIACLHPHQSPGVIEYLCQSFREHISLNQLEWSYHQLHAWSCVAPLHVACTGYNQNLKLVKVLVKLGADVSLKTGCCQVTPLHLAVASYGSDQAVDIARFLMDCGASVNIVDRNGDTPLTLMLRCCGGNEYKEIMDLLLSKEVDVNHANNLGCTALHYAALSNDVDAVVSLLSRGAFPMFELAIDPASSVPCPLYLATLEEVADVFTSRSDCPLTCKIDSSLLIGATTCDDEMWRKAIALREEHGLVPLGDYSIDGIKEIKNTDELEQYLKHKGRFDSSADSVVAQSLLIKERCLRYFCSLDDFSTISYSTANHYMSDVSVSMKCLKLIAHSFHNTILPHWSLGIERYWQQKLTALNDTVSMIGKWTAENSEVSLSRAEKYAELSVGVLQALNHSYEFGLCTKTTSMHFKTKNAIWVLLDVLVEWLYSLGMTDPASDNSTFYPLRQVIQKLVDQNLYLMNTTLLHLIPTYFSYCQCDDAEDVVHLYSLVHLYELILQSDGGDSAVNFVSCEGSRPLHCVAMNVGRAERQCLSLVLSLYESGAHLDAVDKHGKSAPDYLREANMTLHLEQYIPSSPPPLACLASRTIVKENIPYLRMDVVPSKMKRFVALHDPQCCVYSSP